jgi:hypothetical protein
VRANANSTCSGGAERWLADHDDAVVLTLDKAFELGRLATRLCLGTR